MFAPNSYIRHVLSARYDSPLMARIALNVLVAAKRHPFDTIVMKDRGEDGLNS